MSLPDWLLNDKGLRKKHLGYNPRLGSTRSGDGIQVIMAELNGVPGVMKADGSNFSDGKKWHPAPHKGWASHHARYKKAIASAPKPRREQFPSSHSPDPILSAQTVPTTTVNELNTGNQLPKVPPSQVPPSQPPQRQLREADPLATTLAGALESLGPRAVGETTWGRVIGMPNNTGFIDTDMKLTEEMLNQPGVMWNTNINPSIVPQAESVYNSMNIDPSFYTSGKGLSAGVGFNDIDLNTGIYDTPFPQSQPMTGLQALRADEKSKGLLYASGKYWAENADGKLEAIPTDLIDGEGTARQQAIAFMENKKLPIVEAVQNNSQVNDTDHNPFKVTDNTNITNSGIGNFNSIQSNSNPGLITAGEYKGLYTNPEFIDNNGFAMYGPEQRMWMGPGGEKALW